MINSKQKGVFMYTGKVNLEVDDYLDLYLVAGKLADQEWQQEIINKLQNYLDGNVNAIYDYYHDEYYHE